MRTIKFEVCIKHKQSGNTWIEVFTIDELLSRNGALYHSGIQEVIYKRQFTGLTDKNGKEIYEGDILTYHDGNGPKKVVEYNDEKGWYRCRFHKGGGFIDTLFYYIERDCEVIGNIHSNPELL